MSSASITRMRVAEEEDACRACPSPACTSLKCSISVPRFNKVRGSAKFVAQQSCRLLLIYVVLEKI